METTNLSIQGVHCGGCTTKVSAALEAVAGANVEEVTVGSARISFDPKQTSAEALAGVVTRLGYQVTTTRVPATA